MNNRFVFISILLVLSLSGCSSNPNFKYDPNRSYDDVAVITTQFLTQKYLEDLGLPSSRGTVAITAVLNADTQKLSNYEQGFDRAPLHRLELQPGSYTIMLETEINQRNQIPGYRTEYRRRTGNHCIKVILEKGQFYSILSKADIKFKPVLEHVIMKSPDENKVLLANVEKASVNGSLKDVESINVESVVNELGSIKSYYQKKHNKD